VLVCWNFNKKCLVKSFEYMKNFTQFGGKERAFLYQVAGIRKLTDEV